MPEFKSIGIGDWAAVEENLRRLSGVEDNAIPMRWKGVAEPGRLYQEGSVVRANAWTVVALRDTDEDPEPFFNGAAVFDKVDAPSWSVDQTQAAFVVSGHTYEFQTGGMLKQAQVWAPEVGADLNYDLWIVAYKGDEIVDTDVIPIEGITAGQWNAINFNDRLVYPGQKLGYYLASLNSSTSQSFSARWETGLNGMQPPAAPPLGALGYFGLGQFNFSKIDLDGTDRTAQLQNLTASASIKFTDQVTSYSWNLDITQPPQEFSDHVTIVGGPNDVYGHPTGGNPVMCDFDIPTASTTKYKMEVGGNPTLEWAVSTPRLWFDFAEVNGMENNAFGVRLLFQDISGSDAWDVVSYFNT